jgi:hypothetical protein
MVLVFPYPDKINILLEKQGNTNNYNYFEANFSPSTRDISIISSRADEIILLDRLYKRTRNICFQSGEKTLLRLIYEAEKKEENLKTSSKNL